MATEIKTYKVPAENLAHLIGKIEKLNRKAKKLGIELCTLDVGETVTVRNDDNTIRRYTDVSVSCEAIKLNGYDFIGRVSFDHSEPTVFSVPGKEIPVKYRSADMSCDHCKHNRYRKDVFIVLKEDTGDFMQVGRTCVGDFLGHDPKAVVNSMTWLRAAMDEVSNSEDDGYGGTKVEYSMDTLDFLSHIAASIESFGWVSSAKARDSGEEFSATWMNGWYVDKGDKDYKAPTDGHIKSASDALAWLNVKVASGENLSDYFYNLSISAKDEYVVRKDAPIMASLIAVYKSDLAKTIERDTVIASGNASAHFGEIKKREEFTLTLMKLNYYKGQFGLIEIHNFTDETGNKAVWFSSGNSNMKAGGTYRVKATVKDHKEFRGEAQTYLNRVSVVEIIKECEEAA
jgi:hypothetical protein